MGKALVVKHRLMVDISGGTRKAIVAPADDCPCCDGLPDTCTGDCADDGPGGTLTPATCCLPNSYQLQLTMGGNSSGCQISDVISGGITFHRYFPWETTGGGATATCCLRYLPTGDSNVIRYNGTVQLTVGSKGWGFGSATSCSDKTGPVGLGKIENPGVGLEIYPPMSTNNNTTKWLCALFVLPSEGRCGGKIIFWGVKYFDFNAWYAEHPTTPPPSDQLYAELKCDGATITSPPDGPFWTLVSGSTTGPMPHWDGGTATIKPCCEPTPHYTCAGGTDTSTVWVAGVECVSGNVRDDIWLSSDNPLFSTTKAFAVATGAGTTLCVHFPPTAPTREDMPPGGGAIILAVYDSCSSPPCAAKGCDGVTPVSVTPVIGTDTVAWFGTYPAGGYRIGYVNGAFKYNPTLGWQVNAFGICDVENSCGYKIVAEDPDTLDVTELAHAPADDGQYASQADAEAASAGAAVTVSHPGGRLGVRLDDSNYIDNTVSGSPNPTFELCPDSEDLP